MSGPPNQNANLDAEHGRRAGAGQLAGRPVPGAPRPDRTVLWHGHGRGRPAGGVRARRARPCPSGHRPPAAGDLPRPALAVQCPAILALVRLAARRVAGRPVRAEHHAGTAGLADPPDATATGRPARRARRHHAGLPAHVPAGQPDLRGSHPAVLLAVPRTAAGHAAHRAAAEPRRGGRRLVADPAAGLGRVVAAGRVRRAHRRRRGRRGAARAGRGTGGRLGGPGERLGLARPDRRGRTVRWAGACRGRRRPGRRRPGRR